MIAALVYRHEYLSWHLLCRKHLMSGKLKSLWFNFLGNYLFFAYIVVKFIYLINVVGQLFWINKFLGYDYHMYGFR